MSDRIHRPEDLNQEQLAELVIDLLHRLVVHHGLWFIEVEHQMGMEKALEVIKATSEKALKYK